VDLDWRNEAFDFEKASTAGILPALAREAMKRRRALPAL